MAAPQRINGTLNAILLMLGLVFVTLFASAVGLEGSAWNVLAGGCTLVFLVLNLHPTRALLFRCLPMLALSWLSLLANASTITGLNSLRSVALTSIGILMMAVPPIHLNRRLVRRLVPLYIVTCLAYAAWTYTVTPPGEANAGFNLNPDSAGEQFFVCLVLAVVLLRSRLKWLLALGCWLILITTFASGATGAAVLAVGVYGVFGAELGTFRLARAITLGLRLLVLGAAVFLVSQVLVPTHTNVMSVKIAGRMSSEGFFSARGFIWELALRSSLSSPMSILFGHGPARGSVVIGWGAHSSYLEAVTSYGYPYLLAGTAAVILWALKIARHGHARILAVAVPLMIWGVTETVMFSGLRLPWYALMLCGVYLESHDMKDRELETVSASTSGELWSRLVPASGQRWRTKAPGRPMRPHLSS